MNRFNVKWPQYLGKYDYCLLIKDLILVLVCQLKGVGGFIKILYFELAKHGLPWKRHHTLKLEF